MTNFPKYAIFKPLHEKRIKNVKTKIAGKAEMFDIDRDEPILTSGVVCDLLDIPIWVLKQLDKENVVSPRRRNGKGRLYSQREVGKLKHIWRLMSKRNVKVDGIKVILEMEEVGYAAT